MDKSIVFDTCMQIRHNYDGCKKGMRPEGGRCVPAKGRLKQEGGGGGKGVNKFAVGAGLVGAGAVAGLAGGIVGGAIDRNRALNQPVNQPAKGDMTARREKMAEMRLGAKEGNERKEKSSIRDVRQFKREQGVPDADRRIPKAGERRRPENPRMMGRSKSSPSPSSPPDTEPAKEAPGGDTRKLGRGQGDRRVPKDRRRPENPRMKGTKDSAQLVFDSLAFVKSDRSDAETRSITSSICMIIRADGCKKGMRPEGGRCVPAKGRLKQEGGGGGGSNKGLGAVIGTGLAVGGIVGANVYGATRHGQRTIGKAEEWAGNQAAKFGKDFNKGMDESAARVKETEAYKTASPEAQKQYEKNVSGAKGFGNTVRKIGVHNRRFGKKRQAQNQVIV